MLSKEEQVKSTTEETESKSDQEALLACMKAQSLARKYIQDTGKPEFMNEIYNLFKIMLIPEEALITSFLIQGPDAMASAYRKFAMMIHPDKNPHPCAALAFNKLANAFNTAKQRV